MNNSIITTLIVLGVVIAYFVITDQNAAKFYDLQLKWIGINAKRYWMMLTLGTRLKFDMWRMKGWTKPDMARIIKEQEEYKAQQASNE